MRPTGSITVFVKRIQNNFMKNISRERVYMWLVNVEGYLISMAMTLPNYKTLFLSVKQILDDVLDLWWRLEITCIKFRAQFLSFNTVIYHDFSLAVRNKRCCPSNHLLSIWHSLKSPWKKSFYWIKHFALLKCLQGTVLIILIDIGGHTPLRATAFPR